MIIVSDEIVDGFARRCVDDAFAGALRPRVTYSAGTDEHLDVIVPVFNAPDTTGECVRRVLEFSPDNCTIWLVDDASVDPAIGPMLTAAEGDRRVKVIRRPENLGYLASVNDVIARTMGDVVILNSDTEVTRDWCRKLQQAASSRQDVGIVCPVSDNATILSVIDPAVIAEQGSDAVAKLVEHTDQGFVEIPVAVGFCMLIRRTLIDQIGIFDPVFGAGYGEEVDYSMRALRSGFRILAATHCFVRHVGSQSFGQRPEAGLWRRQAECLTRLRWPEYPEWVRDWWRDSPLRLQTEGLRHAAKDQQDPRCLHVVHRTDYLGGTEGITRELAHGVHADYPSTLVAMSTRDLGWQDVKVRVGTGEPDGIELNRRFRYVNQRLLRLAADLSHDWAERVFTRILLGGEYGLVHFHHLVNWDSLVLPLIAKRNGARVVISLHDLFFLCPDYAQMKMPGFRSCGKERALAGTDCEPCLEVRRWVRSDMEIPLGIYLETRHGLLQRVLGAADLITAPSEFSARRLETAFGDSIAAKTVIIPHGVDISGCPRPKGDEHGPLVVAYFGGTVPHKGFDLICDVAQGLQDAEIEFRVFGAITPEYVPRNLPPIVRLLGKYWPRNMPELLATVDVVLIPSKCEESFSLILSEAWACGVPVVAADSGALAERVKDGVDGWLLDAYEPRQWLERLQKLVADEGRRELCEVRERIQKKEKRTTTEMAQDYLVQYRRLLDQTTATVEPLPAPAEAITLDTESASLRRTDQLQPVAASPAPRLVAATKATLSAVIMVDEGNRQWLDNTFESLRRRVNPVDVFVVWDGPDLDCAVTNATVVSDLQAAAERAQGAWLLILSAGDVVNDNAGSWLDLCAQSDAELVYFDQVHVSTEGYAYAGVSSPPPDRILGLQCPWPSAGCMVRAEAVKRLIGRETSTGAALVALSLRAAAQNIRAHRLPVPVIRRLDVNSADLARQITKLAPVAQEVLGDAFLVRSGDEGWQLIPRITGSPPVTAIAVHGDESQAEETLAELFSKTPTNIVAGSVSTFRERPEQFESCEYILHILAGVRFPGEGWLDVLRAWAVYENAAVVAPRLLGPESGSPPVAYPMGYRFDLSGNAQLVRDPAADAQGLGVESWFAGNRSTVAVLPHCVLLKREGMNPDACLNWPDLDPRQQLDIQLEAMEQGARVLWIRDVVARMQSVDICPEQIPIEARHHSLARDESRFAPELHPTRPRSNYQLTGIRNRKPCIAGAARNVWAAAQYRVDIPLSFLNEENCIEAPLIWRTGNESPPSVFEISSAGAETVMVHNFISDPALAKLEDYRNTGITVIASLDDLLTDVPVYNTFSQTYPDMEERLKRALSMCDRLVVSTPELAGFMSGYCDDIHVVANALPESPWFDENPPERVEQRRLRVGWVGAGQHGGDLEEFAGVVERTAQEVDWVFFGMCPDCLKSLVNEIHLMVPFQHYPRRLRELDLDVGVAPLIDNPFNRCKSHIKLLEYGAMGIPAIASDLAPYRGTPAALVGNEEEWVERILTYAREPSRAVRDGEQLRKWVKSEHLMHHRKALWLKALNLG